MKKAQIIILVGLLVVMLATTVSVSAMPLSGYRTPCPYYSGATCTSCGTGGTAGWWCRSDGNINYYTAGCVYQYYSACSNGVCHCMPIGYADHCYSWVH
jgi:hypothetical protein